MAILHLNAGPLCMEFDPRIGWLRNVRLGKVEVIRAVFGAVRDHNWDTVEPCLVIQDQHINPQDFSLTFQSECRSGDVHFDWIGKLSGDINGTVRFEFKGEAKSVFKKNRIGLCLLHPIQECAGQPCRVGHTDGSITSSNFPFYISPHQPFKNMISISHEINDGMDVEVQFEGEVFEMEDQRNWTDASYKTYGTPLDLPFPVEMQPADQIHQAIQISINDRNSSSVGSRSIPKAEVISLDTQEGGERVDFRLGLGLKGDEDYHDAQSIDRLKRLGLDHFRVDLHPSRSGWKVQLMDALNMASKVGVHLHLAFHIDSHGDSALEEVCQFLQAQKVPVSLVHLFHEDRVTTDPLLIEKAKSIFEGSGIRIELAAGTDAYFAELNRNRESPGSEAFPCYSVNPQVHAFDDASLMETLEAQESTVKSAWEYFGRPVVISPITLRPRFNPNATGDAHESKAGDFPVQADPRQSSLFAAVWTLGSLARLLPQKHVHCLTYYETIGCQGVMELASGTPYPQHFHSVPGGVFPLYHPLRDIAGFSHVATIPSNAGTEVACIKLFNAGHERLLIGNLRHEEKEVTVQINARTARLRVLDENTVQQAMSDPESFQSSFRKIQISNQLFQIQLQPYAIATIDVSVPD